MSDKAFEEYNRENAERIAYQRIKDAIRNKSILPGRKLSEAALGKVLGMSRTPVRAALKQLEFQGYVKIIPNKGAYVIEPSIQEIDNTYVVRTAMEQLSVALLIQNLTEQKIEELEECIESEQNAYESNDYDEYDMINRKYHMKIAELSENCVLYKYIKELLNKVDAYIFLRGKSLSGESLIGAFLVEASIKDHRMILECVRAKDVKAAQQCMAEHIQHAKARLILDIKSQSPIKDFLSF